ncbi:MAG: TonB-dependent receptor [Rikenellaceae bacterium]
MKRITLFLLTLYISVASLHANSDSLAMEHIEVTAIKQGLSLRHESLSATVLGAEFVERERIESIKEAQYAVPNLFIPDYGSRITSSIYVRGLGARIDQPVIGLTVDNLPYLNKNAFDTNVVDIARMEFLRGPQSTLYGRNTMGGMVNIYTLSPFDYQGVKLSGEYGSGNSYRAKASLYTKFSDRLALSVSGFYNSTDGFFTNEYNGELLDWESEVGGRFRMQYRGRRDLYIDNTLSISDLNQGGYPYYSLDNEEISYNDPTGYDRLLIGEGLSVRKIFEKVEFSSITGYQYLDDSMVLDNDFTDASYFTLTQATEEHSISQDFVLRSRGDKKYNYLFGAFGFLKHQSMSAPVEFKEDGIESLIIDAMMETGAFDNVTWGSDRFTIPSDFNTQTYGFALYHESSLKIGRWGFTASIRGDYEHVELDYCSSVDTSIILDFSDPDFEILNGEYSRIVTQEDDPSQDFFVLLPKVAASYRLNGTNSLFASVSRGYKSGGYNTNLFADILKDAVSGSSSSAYKDSEVEAMINYDPEYSWNYEVGAKLSTNDNSVMGEVSMFYIDCTNQQLTVMKGTGRMMTNAGQSRSWGAEVSLVANVGRFRFNTAYGYADAKFTKYDDQDDDGTILDYSGSYVPYAPQHTLYAGAIYSQPINYKSFKSLDFEVSTNGAGRIYWDELNSLSQPFYALLSSSITLRAKSFDLSVWGRNITDKSYDTFYFESIDNEFVQRGRPATYGVTVNININK